MNLKKNGITKIELLICTVILSALGAFGGGAWIQHLPDYRLDTAVRDLWTTMQVARLRSIKENAPVAVVFNRKALCYEAFVDSGGESGAIAENGIREPGERLIQRNPLPPGIEVHRITFRAGRLKFNSRGFPAGLGSFYLKNRRGKYLGISVAFSGALTLKKSTDGGKTWKKL